MSPTVSVFTPAHLSARTRSALPLREELGKLSADNPSYAKRPVSCDAPRRVTSVSSAGGFMFLTAA